MVLWLFESGAGSGTRLGRGGLIASAPTGSWRRNREHSSLARDDARLFYLVVHRIFCFFLLSFFFGVVLFSSSGHLLRSEPRHRLQLAEEQSAGGQFVKTVSFSFGVNKYPMRVICCHNSMGHLAPQPNTILPALNSIHFSGRVSTQSPVVALWC